MSQVNANRSLGAEDLTRREASGAGVAPRGGDRAAALGRGGQGRGS